MIRAITHAAPPPPMKVWVVAVIALCLALLVSDVVVIAVTATVGRSTAFFSYAAVLSAAQADVARSIDGVLQPMVLAAETVAQADAAVRACALPLAAGSGAYDPSTLIALQNAYSGDALTTMQSVGVLTAYGAGNASVPDDFTNKESWEVAQGFGCPSYIYGYTDASLSYLGYCAWPNGTVDRSRAAYVGADYGLAPQERSLMLGQAPAVFLPIFDLLGSFSLTYERAWRCDASQAAAYALTFAEKNLGQLDAALAALDVGAGGRAYVVEAATGLLVSASVPGQTYVLTSNGTASRRVNATDAADRLIRTSAQLIVALEGSFAAVAAPTTYESGDRSFAVDARPYAYAAAEASPGWIQVSVIVEADYVGWTSSSVGMAVLAAALVGLGLAVLFAVALRLAARRASVSTLGYIESKLDEQ